MRICNLSGNGDLMVVMNRLAEEKSLYLRQHAENPVDWYPWGDEAFEAARSQDKPVLVSIGYSSCHWCHVMAHESFEDPYIARLMNAHFVCIKVDREEHPDVDRVYMESVQMMNGHGGWPLNVFCLPDGRPFAGGTYFPPDEKKGYQIVPWPQLILRVSDFFRRKRGELEENAKAIIGNLEATNAPPYANDSTPDGDALFTALDMQLENHDERFGGFGGAPKFPPSMTLDFLLAMRATESVEQRRPEYVPKIDRAVNATLRAMARGGLYDHIGGGFYRYSVDATWTIPHFEKMLYDNALLLDIYTKAWLRYRDPLYAAVVRETIEWLLREMKTSGAFAAAIDADSAEGEGAFYVWTPSQIAEVLGDQADEFCKAYGITSDGNFEDSGRSNPRLISNDPGARESWAEAREKLYSARKRRPHPARDDKALVFWNALLVPALIEAGFAFDRPDWFDEGMALADWLWTVARGEDNRLARVVYNNDPVDHTTERGHSCPRTPTPPARSGIPVGHGLLNDHAATAAAMLSVAGKVEWRQPGQSREWIQRAAGLMEVVLNHFADNEASGYFLTADFDPQRIHRSREWLDQATPCGNSIVLHVFSQLATVRAEDDWKRHWQNLAGAYGGMPREIPQGIGHALSALVQDAMGLCVVKIPDKADREEWRRKLADMPWRRTFIETWQEDRFQICVGTTCTQPTESLNDTLG